MEDTDIVALFFERDEKAIVQTQNKYGKQAHSLSENIVRNREDAEECVNDAYLKLWNAIPPRRPVSLGAFLLKIVRNLSLDRYRRLHTQKRFVCEVAFSELEGCLEDREGNLMVQMETNDITQALNRFLETLDEKERFLFMRRYWFMDEYKTLARMTCLSEGNVRQRVFRTREKLKVFLMNEGIEI